MNYAEKAKELFLKGYNCAQAVAGAFCEEMNLTERQAVRAVSAFGGGMGRMREVCGSVSGMAFVFGMLLGYDDPTDNGGKKELYATVREGAERFRRENGSIVCRELLGIAESGGNPEPRTKEYYQKRPCAELVAMSAGICADILLEKGALHEKKD